MPRRHPLPPDHVPRRALFALGAMIGTALVGSPTAQADPAGYETVVFGDSVEEKPPEDDPAGFSAVIKIKDVRPGTELSDLVRRVPGTRPRDTGPGGRKTVTMRGSDAQQTVVMLDGFRLTPPSGGGVDLSLVDPAHLEAVEIRRGGGSARFGTNAVGGVMLLRTPTLRTRSRSRAAVSYGSWNTLAAHAGHFGTAGPLRYLVSGTYRRTDGDFSFKRAYTDERLTRVNNDHNAGELLLKLDYLAGDLWQLVLINNSAVMERGAPGLEEFQSERARQFDLRTLTGVQAIGRDLLGRDSKLNMAVYQRYNRFVYDRPSMDPTTVSARAESDAHAFGAWAKLGVPLGRWGRVDGGMELIQDMVFDADVDDPTRLSFDLWLSGELRVARGMVSFVPALRLAVASGFDAEPVPKIGVIGRPFLRSKNGWLQPLELLVNLGRSFRVPSFQELYIQLFEFGGNPDLRPEDSTDWDVGMRWRGERLSVEAAYFRRDILNSIIFAPVSASMIKAQNTEEATIQGAEVALTTRPGWGLLGRLGYTYLHSRTGDPAVLQFPSRPEHRLFGRLEWARGWKWERHKPRWRLRLWTEATYESSMPLDLFNNITVDGRVLLDATAALSYRWLTVTIEGKNLLNQQHVRDTIGFPLAPASFRVTLAYNG